MNFLQRILTIIISAGLSVITTVYILHNEYPKPYTELAAPTFDSAASTSNIAVISDRYKKSVILVDAVQNAKSEKKDEEISTGTGFVIDYKGAKYILTNEHVVNGTDKIQIELSDNSITTVELIGSDYDLDLAVLKPTDENVLKSIPALPLSTVKSYKIGEPVIAIGFPLDVGFTVTSGIISSTEKQFPIESREYEHLIQTDAAINPGNSGGPLIDASGNVIGINTAIVSDSQGIGFSIPIETALANLDSLIADGNLSRPFMGVQVDKVEDSVTIVSIVTQGPADKAGLKVKDIVISIDGVKITNSEELISEVKKKKVGDTVVVKIKRDGDIIDKTITILDKTEIMNLQN